VAIELKLGFLASLLFKKVRGRGVGCLFEGGHLFDIMALRVGAYMG